MADTEIVIEAGRQDIVITRVFDAPRDLVFRVCTDPDLIPQWWGRRQDETVVDVMEVRPGGRWRFLNRDAEGNEFAFRGVYHDVVAPDRLVQTFEFEGAPGHVALDTFTLEQVDEGTRVVAQSVFQTVEARDAMVASGMEEGARELWDRLAELVERLR